MAATAATAAAQEQSARVLAFLRRPKIEADLSCMMCGRTVGQIIDGRIVHRAGCGGKLRIDRGILRCCNCGGSVYREPVSPFSGR